MKLAIMAGVTGAGAEVYDIGTAIRPQLIYAASLLDCGIIAHIKCGIFSQIQVFASHGLGLARIDERRLEAALNRSEYKNADWSGFGRIHTMTGFTDVYTAMLRNHTDFRSNYRIKINCNNAALCRTLTPAFNRVSNPTPNSEILVVTLTEGGSEAEFYTENDVKIGYDKLLLLAAASHMSKGYDVALPNDFAGGADFLAASYGRKIHRYFICPNDNSDRYARQLAAGQPFLRDGAILALNVLEHLSRSALTIEGAVKTLPQFATTRREVEINCPPQRIISKLCALNGNNGSTGGNAGKGEGIIIGNHRENVLIRSAKRGNALYLYAESLSSETAEELCVNAENLVKKLNEENK
jgi:mannose-1-phosphate guanylyltransferase/phosphomannomutase